MTIRFNMTAAQQAALDQLLANLQDPHRRSTISG